MHWLRQPTRSELVASGSGRLSEGQSRQNSRLNRDFAWACCSASNRDDSGRTGAHMNETVLNQKNVNANSFGQLFARNVDRYQSGQPCRRISLGILCKVLVPLNNMGYKCSRAHRALHSQRYTHHLAARTLLCPRTFPHGKLHSQFRSKAKLRLKNITKIHYWIRIKSRETSWLDSSRTI